MLPAAILSIILSTLAVAASPHRRVSYWHPSPGDSFQIILSGVVDLNSTLTPDVSIFDIDGENHPKEAIAKLKGMGKRVICYFSAGSSESNRIDSSRLNPYRGKQLKGWPDEHWLDIRKDEVRQVMKDRIARMSDKGCDAIDPDNIDGYDNDNGLGLKPVDSVSYMQFLSTEATAKGMSIGLKNSAKIIPDILASVHFAVVEQCQQYGECDNYTPFIQAGKPVFDIEYVDNDKAAPKCPASNLGFTNVVKKMNLDGWVKYCNGTTATTVTGTADTSDSSAILTSSSSIFYYLIPLFSLLYTTYL